MIDVKRYIIVFSISTFPHWMHYGLLNILSVFLAQGFLGYFYLLEHVFIEIVLHLFVVMYCDWSWHENNIYLMFLILIFFLCLSLLLLPKKYKDFQLSTKVSRQIINNKDIHAKRIVNNK